MPIKVTKDSLISIGLAIAFGTAIFVAGTFYQKVSDLESLQIAKQLALIRTDVALIKQKLNFPNSVIFEIHSTAER